MRIVHFSDPHAGGRAEDWMAYIDKRIVGVFNYRFRRRFKHDLGKLAQAVDYILDTRPDAAVCTGDLTSTGQPGEFAKVLPIMKPLRESGIPFIYMPGNHDCYVKRPKCVNAVNEMFAYLNGGMTFNSLPRKREIAGADFLMVNTSRPSNLLCSWGFLSRKDVNWIKNICSGEHSRPRIFVSHYPLFEDHPILRTRHRLFGEKPVRQMIEQGIIDLSLCGHVHSPYTRVNAQGKGENCAGSVTRNGTISDITYDPVSGTFSFSTIQL